MTATLLHPAATERACEISAREVEWLNFYRVSELHGGLVLGQLVPRARDPELVLALTRHAAEEVEHSRLWAETILGVGGRIRPVRRSYQRGYAELLGAPSTMLEVLALTQVFERRVFRHFTLHLRRPGTHPTVRATLRRMLDEERDHLGWVRRWLDARPDQAAVRAVLRRFAEADARVYESFLDFYEWRAAA
jgi:demethoxyubiquinone hydroxylase (CLK1/Coq7/Cat5 family)